jgi:hypothetical protein
LKILFYLEPFPVRGRPLDFLWIWERWSLLASGLQAKGVECAFAVSDALKASILLPTWPVKAPSDLGVSKEQQREDDTEWVRLMSDPTHEVWGPFAGRLLEDTSPDVILTWTTNRSLQRAAAARGIPVLHTELGPIRLPWGNLYFADPRGVNGASSLPQLWPEIRTTALTAIEERQLDAFVSEFVRTRTNNHLLDSMRTSCGLQAGKQTVGIFLQCPRDSNVLVWSRVKGNDALLREVVRRFPPADYQYLIKPHPRDPDPKGIEGFRQCLVPTCRAQDVIDLCDVVCTINSSVGIEALAAEKPVYTFGASPYEVEGCTRSAVAEAPGPCPLFNPSERDLSRKLMHFLFFRYFAWEDEAEDPDAFAARVFRFVAWHHAGGSLNELFIADRDASRLIEIRRRGTWLEAKGRLEEEMREASSLASRLAAAEAQIQLLDNDRHELQLAAANREAHLARIEATLDKDTRHLQTALAELGAAKAAVENLENSLAVRVRNALLRIPGIEPLVRRARTLAADR